MSAFSTFGASRNAASGPPGVRRVSTKVKLIKTSKRSADWMRRRIRNVRIARKRGGRVAPPPTVQLDDQRSLLLQPPIDDLEVVLAQDVAAFERHDVLNLLVEGREVLERDHVVIGKVVH